MIPYTYTAYGLHFASAFPLPELRPATNGKPDITICYGEVPEALPLPSDNGVAWQSAPGQMLLSVSEVARYLIIDNREIRIEPLPGSVPDDVRIFLLGSVLGALLHARQMLVLHASVIQTERGAVLFMGRSGAGKSTLLGAFLKRGYTMLADDKAGVRVNAAGVTQIMPGYPTARMTKETVEVLNFPLTGARLSRGLDKYVFPVERFCATPLTVHTAYSLNVHNQPEIRFEPLQCLDQFHVLNRHTYRRRFLQRAQQQATHFQLLGALAAQARVVRVTRPDDPARIDELVACIEEDFMR